MFDQRSPGGRGPVTRRSPRARLPEHSRLVRRRSRPPTTSPDLPRGRARRADSVPAVRLADVTTPALVVDRAAFDRNVATMAAVCPGPRLRPHVKAFKSTDLAARLAAAGHRTFCCATAREVEGMAAAGLGDDLLLANEVLDARRLGAVVEAGARVTVAVDSPATIEAAARGGVREVLVDVDVGMPRCGCDPEDAGASPSWPAPAGSRCAG